MNPTLEEFIFYSRNSQTIEELFSLYEKVLENYGFDHLAYAVISDHPSLKNGNELGIIQKNSLNDWDDYYLDKDYLAIDATPRLAYANPGVFTWDSVVKNKTLSTKQLNIFNEANEAKLYNGLSAAVHGPDGTKGVALISSSQRKLTVNPHAFDIINIISYHFHLCFLSLMNFKSSMVGVSLSLKEETVLKWAAKGLTKIEIGDRLNLSAHTIDYHIRNILKKLEAKNLAAALVTAIKNNIIAI